MPSPIASEEAGTLEFSDRDFAAFFAAELHVDIEDTAYSIDGTSKGRRLRRYLVSAD